MLTTKQLNAIEQLQKKCEQEEGIHLKLNWSMLRQRENEEMDFFLWQGDELIAFLGLYGFGSTVEVCGMVAPSERRKGIYTSLWDKALMVINDKGYKKILLNAPGSSDSAKGWLAGLPCDYVFSEYQMQWEQQIVIECNDVILRESTRADDEFEIKLDMLAFHLTEEDATEHHSRVLSRPDEIHYIIEKDTQRVGKIGVSKSSRKAYIYGFAVMPEFQGKGYGGKALRNVVHLQNEAGYIIELDVETKNENALQLYKNVGFETIQRQDYYSWK